MTNYLYPALGGAGGGGGVNSVTASLPLVSTGGVNPNISISTIYYDVGVNMPYATIADAIAAAVADGATHAAIRYVDSATITENVALPKGMSLVGLRQNGVPTQTISGSITSAAGIGISVVVGFIIANNGSNVIVNANAATNINFTDCIFSQSTDNAIVFATAGTNATFSNCTFSGLGLTTAPAFNVMNGNVVLTNCSTLGISSNLFLSMSGGGITISNSTLNGKCDWSGGIFRASTCLFANTSGAVLDHTSASAATLINCQISSTDGGTNAITGTGTIQYYNVIFTNTQQGIDNTITWKPAPEVGSKEYVADAKTTFAGTEYGQAIDSLGYLAWNTPTTVGYKWNVGGSQIVQLTEYGIRGTTNPAIGSFVPSFKWETSGNISMPAAESSNALWDFSHEQNFAAGVVSAQREFYIKAPTYSGTGPGTTLSKAATFGVEGPPDQGSNATLTIAVGIDVAYKALSSASSIGGNFSPSGLVNGIGNSGVHTGLTVFSGTAIALSNQTATTSYATSVYLPQLQWSAVTNTRTITNLATLFIANAPSVSGTVAVTNGPYAIWIDAGSSRFDGRVLQGQGSGIVSATDLTLGNDGNYFIITNSTDIERIATAGWTSGSMVRLGFTNALNIIQGVASGGGFAKIETEGSANIACVNGTELLLSYSASRDSWTVMCVRQP